MTRIAVLMPYRNAERYIRLAVESILSQTYSDFTLFAINDRSYDESTNIIRSLDDERISIIESSGTGVSAALNTGLRQCSEYSLAARHDADDLSYPNRFAEQANFLLAHQQTAVLAAQADKIDANGLPCGQLATPCRHEAIRAALKRGNPICHGSVMLRPDPVLQAGSYDVTYPCAQGYELWVRIAQHHIIQALPQALYKYRIYEESWSRSQRPLRNELIGRIRQRANKIL